MPLTTGTKLGPYEIRAPIGAGGMGEVYRAHDPRMGRDVAIKISAERFSDRFSREVHAVASLNHPNICQLYGVGSDYLVMELVDGPTLSERFRQGAVPLDEALRIARQIAAALEDAHEKGIVHRDLKPGNIILRPDGTVKVLDFGLAKVTDKTPSGAFEHSQSPTLDPVSRVGLVVGTAAYMPPEQARGKLVDKRADIWAFGVILYEMLTGERPFAGETVSDTLIEVATKEPDLERIPTQARRLLRRCLEKDPKRRLRDIGDAWFWLEDAPPEEAVTSPTKRGRWRLPVTLTAIATLIAAAFAVGHYTRKLPAAAAIRFSFAPPFKTASLNVAASPDGTQLAFTGIYGDMGLWLSSIDSTTIEKLPVGDEAVSTFWSPDGRSLGFISPDGQIRRLNLASVQTPPQTVTAPANPFAGAAWSPLDVIPSRPGPGFLAFRPAAERRLQPPGSTPRERKSSIDTRSSCLIAATLSIGSGARSKRIRGNTSARSIRRRSCRQDRWCTPGARRTTPTPAICCISKAPRSWRAPSIRPDCALPVNPVPCRSA
jgi:serine/threonine-protein kinase